MRETKEAAKEDIRGHGNPTIRHGSMDIDGDWAKSLGNPIGNDLEGGKKFIEKKLEAVRNKSKKWFGLYTAKYQGRNLKVEKVERPVGTSSGS